MELRLKVSIYMGVMFMWGIIVGRTLPQWSDVMGLGAYVFLGIVGLIIMYILPKHLKEN